MCSASDLDLMLKKRVKFILFASVTNNFYNSQPSLTISSLKMHLELKQTHLELN